MSINCFRRPDFSALQIFRRRATELTCYSSTFSHSFATRKGLPHHLDDCRPFMTSDPVPDAHLCPIDDVGLLGFEGPDARAFLQGQFSNDVEALSHGHGQWSSYNSPKGRVLANFWLWQAPGGLGLERYEAFVGADLAAVMQKRLSMFVLRAKVRVTDRSSGHRFFGVVGAGASAALMAAYGSVPPPGAVLDIAGTPAQIVALPDGRFVVIATAEAAGDVDETLARHATRADADRWRAFGVAAGIPWITAATSDRFVAQMINWDALSGVSFQKGCYPGQEVVARMRYLGRLKERLFRLHADAPPPSPGARLFSPAFGDQACGTVVNAAAAQGGGTDVLSVVQLAAIDAPGLALAAPDGVLLETRSLPYPLPDVVVPPGRIA
jgi:tRNA-modifying protein YgfZ